MADKNDSSSNKPGDKATTKPGNAPASADKKPKPLLDLKATEVRSGTSGSGGTPAPSSGLKGAPGWKDPADKGKPAAVAPATGGSSVPAAGSSSSTKPAGSTSTPAAETSAAAKMASVTPPSGSGKGSVNTASAATGKPTATAVPAGASASAGGKPPEGKAGAGKSGASASAPPSGSKPAGAATPPPARSGGGFFSTLSHLAAGVVGGGIALFAAEPIGQQFGVALTSQPKIPAAVEQRLAALEAKPAASPSDGALRKDVAQLSERVSATQKRLAELDALGKQVATLASDVKKSGAAAASGSASSGSAAPTDDAQASALRARLAKLENALSTLASATTSSGKPSGIASLAKFSAKFADLEGSLNTQLGTLRKSLMTEIAGRIATTSDATAKAVAGTERLDRAVSEIKTDTARLDQRAIVLKTASDKLTASTRAISEQSAQLKVELDGLKGDLKQELAKVARPGDVAQAIAPVSKKVAAIEKNLGSVLASETARKANAERIVLSLELSKLKRVLDRGQPYGTELADVKKIAGDAVDFGALDAHKGKGVPSGQELTRQFNSVAYQIINAQDAPKDDSRINRLFAAAKSIVQVRRTDIPAEEKTAEAAVARIENHLKNGDMSGALALAEKLPDQAKAPARGWMSQLAARAGVDRAIAKIEDQLKASLGGAAEKKS